MRLKVGVVYLITYPNGKIYIGQDRTDDVNYFGSADSFTIAQDFGPEQRDDFSVRKQVLERLENCTVQELNILERKWIAKFRSNDPEIGYNRTGVARRIARTVWDEEGMEP
jgi:hypothetical protein